MNYQGIGFVFIFAWDIFFDDDNDKNEILKIARVHRYAEEIVPRFSDQTFKMHFRITPNTFEGLLEKLYNIEDNNNIHVGCKLLPLEKKLMITIWYLSNIESFR